MAGIIRGERVNGRARVTLASGSGWRWRYGAPSRPFEEP